MGVSKEQRKKPIVQMGLFMIILVFLFLLKHLGNTLDHLTMQKALSNTIDNLNLDRLSCWR